jgi:D-3-phosphoglycerate dehydrogenase
MAKQFNVQILNQISQVGLKRLPAERYTVGKEIAQPDVILVRSADMHKLEIPSSVKAVGRARRDQQYPDKGHVGSRRACLQHPGANANAVKELVIAVCCWLRATWRELWITSPDSTER